VSHLLDADQMELILRAADDESRMLGNGTSTNVIFLESTPARAAFGTQDFRDATDAAHAGALANEILRRLETSI
jgi:hypothetical protein